MLYVDKGSTGKNIGKSGRNAVKGGKNAAKDKGKGKLTAEPGSSSNTTKDITLEDNSLKEVLQNAKVIHSFIGMMGAGCTVT